MGDFLLIISRFWASSDFVLPFPKKFALSARQNRSKVTVLENCYKKDQSPWKQRCSALWDSVANGIWNPASLLRRSKQRSHLLAFTCLEAPNSNGFLTALSVYIFRENTLPIPCSVKWMLDGLIFSRETRNQRPPILDGKRHVFSAFSAVHGSVLAPRGNRLPASRLHTYRSILACNGGSAKEGHHIFALKAQNGLLFCLSSTRPLKRSVTR